MYSKSNPVYNQSMIKQKYTVKRAYAQTSTGREIYVWHIMDGDFVVDACNLKRDAKYYCDLWHAEQNGVQQLDVVV